MDLPLVSKTLNFSKKNKNYLLLLALFGASGYGAYKIYHSPSISKKRKRFMKLLGALISLSEMLSDSSETFLILSRDMKEFLNSDSDEIPNSLKQISKIATSHEFSASISRVTEAVIVGIIRGYELNMRNEPNSMMGSANSSFSDKIIDRLFSKAGSGFASVVVGSFARNLVLGFYSNGGLIDRHNKGDMLFKSSDVPGWVDVVCNDKSRKVIGDCVQIFVSTAVSVFLDKTMDVNTYDEFFAGLTNPKHQDKVRDILVSLCNGAVETFIKTSHDVLKSSSVNSNPRSPSASFVHMNGGGTVAEDNECLKPEAYFQQIRPGGSISEVQDSSWFEQISSTLLVPANRKFVLDVTGRVTFETVRSFVEFVLWRISDCMKSSLSRVHDEAVGKGMALVRYVGAKSSIILTMCLAMYLHILGVSRIAMPA